MPNSILSIKKEISQQNFKPIYYLYGEDSFNISSTVKLLLKETSPFIDSEFDKEILHGKDLSTAQLLQSATSFPFGSQKKIIVVKEFEEVRDKNNLTEYVKNPSDFTILIISHYGKITNINSEPFKILNNNNFLYEAKILKGNNLISWLIAFSESKKIKLSSTNAKLLVDLVGENRDLLVSQLDKIFTFLGERDEITFEDIKLLAAKQKEFTVFDLQDSISAKNKADSMKVAINMLNNGKEVTEIIGYLTRFFMNVAKVFEMEKNKVNNSEGAKTIGIHPFYYSKCRVVNKKYSNKNLLNVFRTLLKADKLLKTTNTDKITIVTIMITEMLQS